MSKVIQSLESDLGLTLFHAKRGGIQLSDAGVSIFRQTEKLFRGVWKISEYAEQLRDGNAGTLRIASVSMLSVELLPNLISEFLRGRSEISIELETFSSNEIVRLVRDRQFDMGFLSPPIDVQDVDLITSYRVRSLCICPPDSDLAGPAPVRPHDLAHRPFVSLGKDSLTRLRTDEIFSALNVPRKMSISARAPASVSAFVLNGDGYSIVDPFTAEMHVHRGGRALPFSPSIPSTIIWVRQKGSPFPKVAGDFQDFMDMRMRSYLMTNDET